MKREFELIIKNGIFIIFFSFLGISPGFCGDKENLKIEDLVITAEKRASRAKDFSGSIVVKDQSFIEDYNIRDLNELSSHIPNIYFKKTSSGDSIVSRGISTIDTSLFSPMGLYIDDIAYPLSYMQNQPLRDIERVEVLRGPNGTLYGRNSESGVINIVTKQPDNEVNANIYTGYGNYSTFNTGFLVDGPVLKDRLFMGASASYNISGGYMENEVTGSDDCGDDESKSFKVKLRWTPRDKSELIFSLDTFDRELGISRLRFENGPEKSGRLKVRSSEEDDSNENGTGQSLKYKYSFDKIDFISITGHRTFNKNFIHDFDRTPKKLGFSNMDMENDSWSQEFRFSSKDKSKFTWLFGFYGGVDDLDAGMIFDHVSPKMAKKRKTQSSYSNYALFGRSTLKISKRFKVSAGLRVEAADAFGEQDFKSSKGNLSFDDDFFSTEILPGASIHYELNKNAGAYLSLSRGWLAGGFNYFSATSKDNFTYDPEYTINYEAGVKTAFFDNRLKADLSVFYTNIEDKQVREEVPGGGPGVWKFTNAARANVKGFELDVQAFLFKGLELFAGAGYASSKIDDWSGRAFGKAIDYSGNNLPWAPEFTWNAGAGYYMNSGIYFVADLSGCSKRYFDAANTIDDEGYIIANLKSGFRFKSYDISIWCKNIFDEEYINKKVNNAMGNTMVEDGEPMRFGITIDWKI